MILTVTPNPAVDVTILGENLWWGESNRVPPARSRAGGKGINVSRVLHQMGWGTTAVAAVGESDIEAFRRDLGEIPSALVSVAGAARRSYAVVNQTEQQTTLFNENGYPLDSSHWDIIVKAVSERVGESRCLVVAGSVPPGVTPEQVVRLFEPAAAVGIPTVADLTGAYLSAAAQAGVDLLKPNRRELAEATGLSDPIDGARALQRLGAGTVVVSLGSGGMLVVPPGAASVALHAQSAILSGNPTGAGDAAVASIAAHLAEGESDPDVLLARAVAWSAAAVREPQAGRLNLDYTSFRPDIRRVTSLMEFE